MLISKHFTLLSPSLLSHLLLSRRQLLPVHSSLSQPKPDALPPLALRAQVLHLWDPPPQRPLKNDAPQHAPERGERLAQDDETRERREDERGDGFGLVVVCLGGDVVEVRFGVLLERQADEKTGGRT
jgi:hypothetical protein